MMPTAEMVCIVEGHGDREAVPILIRRIAAQVDPALSVTIPAVIRTPRSKLIKPKELERVIELAARRRAGSGGVLVVVDSDTDCPAVLGPALLYRARQARADVSLGVVLAKREYEAWLIAAAQSLRGKRGLPEDLESPTEPEEIESPKGWLRLRMPAEKPYSETIDQPAFTGVFDIATARRADSFDKCYREIARLISAVMLE